MLKWSVALPPVEEHVHDNKDYDLLPGILTGFSLIVEEHVHDNKDYDPTEIKAITGFATIPVEEHVHDNKDELCQKPNKTVLIFVYFCIY